jgi:hypothetical protein
MRANELIGEKFGRLTVIGKGERGKVHWKMICLCECGNQTSVVAYSLRQKTTTSCGCYRNEILSLRRTTHGKSKTHELYKTWAGMHSRCKSTMHKAYLDYGGRGIKVCERWHKFENFLADIGERPFNKASLDRIDNDGDYEPSNVRWATAIQQGRNKRNNKLITFNGKTQTLSTWAAELNLNKTTLKDRLGKYGWSTERALTTPVKQYTLKEKS